MKRYTIGIDCRLAGLRHAGIGRYVTELVQHLLPYTETEWVLFFSDHQQAKEMFPESVPKHCRIHIAPVKHYTLREQLELPRIFQSANLDLLHVPHFNIPIFYNGKIVITIHDLLWHEHRGNQVTTLPVWQYWLKYVFYRIVTRIAVSKAAAIFVPTKTVKNILSKYYAATKKKITVTPEAVGSTLQKLAHKKITQNRSSKQLLYVGSLYPHKNVSLILKALAQELTDYHLVIVGSRSVFRMAIEQQVADLHIADRVTFEGGVTDEVLAKQYRKAYAVIQPSFSEGFGLTGLEAMTFGAPVIASDIPVFKEVYQDAAVYFDPHSVSSFSHAVTQLESPQLHQQLSTSAQSISQQYDWATLAKATYQQYMTVLSS